MTTPGVRPGGSSGDSAARCAVCEAEAAPDASYCMACGQPLVAPLDPPLAAQLALHGLTPMRVVEADAPAQPMALARARPMRLASLPRLAALAWRQPAVRSVVTTGASAVALSLVWRVAVAALRDGQARRALLPDFSPSALLDPLVDEALREAAPGKRLSKRAGRRGRRGVVVEELVYVRRVFRR